MSHIVLNDVHVDFPVFTSRSRGLINTVFGYGILQPDNNLIESAIRPVAVGRRSWLFLGAERGGHVAATMYSLIGTCRLNRVEPYAWLCDVLKRLPNHPVTKLAELLPYNWKRQFTNPT